MTVERIRVGVSSCLLGQRVRYDGGHKHDAYITRTLGQYFEFVPLCPEAGIGLGVPRPAMRLVRRGDAVRVVQIQSPDSDHTEALQQYREVVRDTLQQVCGYILKKGSPSCGMERVRVYDPTMPDKPPQRDGMGLFARGLREAFPCLPLEEEGRLCDPVLRENFVGRVYVYHRWRRLEQAGVTAAGLVDFHADHKYILMAHDQQLAQAMGRLVASAGAAAAMQPLVADYLRLLMTALGKPASRGQHANVLLHLMGYLKTALDKSDRKELLETIQRYQAGLFPLIVPLTLLRHHFRRHPQPYINRQHYLNPHPGELMLLNHV